MEHLVAIISGLCAIIGFDARKGFKLLRGWQSKKSISGKTASPGESKHVASTWFFEIAVVVFVISVIGWILDLSGSNKDRGQHVSEHMAVVTNASPGTRTDKGGNSAAVNAGTVHGGVSVSQNASNVTNGMVINGGSNFFISVGDSKASDGGIVVNTGTVNYGTDRELKEVIKGPPAGGFTNTNPNIINEINPILSPRTPEKDSLADGTGTQSLAQRTPQLTKAKLDEIQDALINNFYSPELADYGANAFEGGERVLAENLFRKAEKYDFNHTWKTRMPFFGATLLQIPGKEREGEQVLNELVADIGSRSDPFSDRTNAYVAMGYMSGIYYKHLKNTVQEAVFFKYYQQVSSLCTNWDTSP